MAFAPTLEERVLDEDAVSFVIPMASLLVLAVVLERVRRRRAGFGYLVQMGPAVEPVNHVVFLPLPGHHGRRGVGRAGGGGVDVHAVRPPVNLQELGRILLLPETKQKYLKYKYESA